MRKEKSWTREQYELVYRDMRLGYDLEFIAFNENGGRDVLRAAHYSYHEKEYMNTGWTNQPRKFKFYDLMATRYPNLWFIF